MIAVVVVRKGIKASAKEAAKAVDRREKRAYPLAVLLEQHDIDDQVCVCCWICWPSCARWKRVAGV